jgi:hypothetical protein
MKIDSQEVDPPAVAASRQWLIKQATASARAIGDNEG